MCPTSLRKSIVQTVLYADIKKSGDYICGLFVMLTIILIGVISTFLLLELPLMFSFWAFVSGIGVIFIIYILIYFKAEARANSANKELPNALSVIGANLRSGMTPYHAIKQASKEDMGVLSVEFRKATARTVGTRPFVDYLLDISNRIDSSQLKRSLKLFVSSLRSGGKVIELLDELSRDISQRLTLHKDLMTYMKTNVMFIMFIVIVGMPALLSISVFFLDSITDMQSRNAGSNSNDLVGFGGELVITSDYLITISYVVMFLTGLFACFFLGSIVDGDGRKGLKFAPLLIGGPYILFFVARFVISVMA